MWCSFGYLLAFISSPHKLALLRTSSKIAEMLEQSPRNLAIHRFWGLLHPSLYQQTPASDGELCFLCLKFTQQEDRVVSLREKSCLAYGPLLQLEERFSCPGSSASRGEGTEKRKHVTHVAARVESCPSRHRSSSQQPFSCRFIIFLSLNRHLCSSLLEAISPLQRRI